MFVQDYILNGQGFGEVGSVLGRINYDSGYQRPYFDDNGERVVDIRKGTRYDDKKKRYVPKVEKVRIKDLIANGMSLPIFNATSLRKEEWLMFDSALVRESRQRLSAWGDLVSMSGTKMVPGMSKRILEHETATDPGEALVDMDGLAEDRDDAHEFQLEGIPLPITHSGFRYSLRELSSSRDVGSSLDTVKIEAATRRVAEKVERTLIGTATGMTYGGNSTQVGGYGRASTVFGYTNFTSRLTKSDLTTPTGANPDSTVNDVLEMREQLYQAGFFGPFMLYHSTDWDEFMDSDYAFVNGTGWAVNPNLTLRDRLLKIPGIRGVRRLDFLPASTNPFALVMVQMTPDVCRAVDGMRMNVIQWEEKGGMELRFKVMCIYVPQLRATYAGNCGILHATTS